MALWCLSVFWPHFLSASPHHWLVLLYISLTSDSQKWKLNWHSSSFSRQNVYCKSLANWHMGLSSIQCLLRIWLYLTKRKCCGSVPSQKRGRMRAEKEWLGRVSKECSYMWTVTIHKWKSCCGNTMAFSWMYSLNDWKDELKSYVSVLTTNSSLFLFISL